MSKPRLTIGISIGKNDLDIAAWYNMLKANELSLSIWTSSVVLAYVSEKTLDIGTVCLEKKKGSTQASLMFGSGNSQNAEKGKKRGWNVKGAKGEYIEGSVVTVPLYNKDAVFALKKLKEKGFPYSSTVKSLIRQNLKIGNETIPPVAQSKRSEDQSLLLAMIDRTELRSPIEEDVVKKEEEKNPKKDTSKKEGTNKESRLSQSKLPIQSSQSSGSSKSDSVAIKPVSNSQSIKNPLLDLI